MDVANAVSQTLISPLNAVGLGFPLANAINLGVDPQELLNLGYSDAQNYIPVPPPPPPVVAVAAAATTVLSAVGIPTPPFLGGGSK